MELITHFTGGMTHTGQMTTPKLLINFIWTCQEIMGWMSRELNGSMNVIWYDFGTEVWQIMRQILIFVIPSSVKLL
jgi:hypothetical protein